MLPCKTCLTRSICKDKVGCYDYSLILLISECQFLDDYIGGPSNNIRNDAVLEAAEFYGIINVQKRSY